jgi:hypothetical protein
VTLTEAWGGIPGVFVCVCVRQRKVASCRPCFEHGLGRVPRIFGVGFSLWRKAGRHTMRR